MTVGDWMDEMEEEIREAVVEEIREETEKRVREETEKRVREETEKRVREETEKRVREETEKKVREENIKVFIETLQEFIDSKEQMTAKVREKYPDYAENANELVEKYWQDN